DMRHVVKRLGAVVTLRGAREVIERQRPHSHIGKAQGQLSIEVVETTGIRENDNLRSGAFSGRSEIPRNLGAVSNGYGHILTVGAAVAREGHGRMRIVVKAHCRLLHGWV